MKKTLRLIYIFFLIGLQSLGNMSAVTVILQENLIIKNKLVNEEDIIDAIALARLGPGATTANAVAYLGNKISGFWGGVIATVCYTIGPLIVIAIIYGFIEKILQFNFVNSALKGGLICISIMFIKSTIEMGKNILKNKFNIIIFITTLTILLFCKISCIWVIIIAIIVRNN